MPVFSRFAAAPAVLAALSLVSVPASAADLPAAAGRSAVAAAWAWSPQDDGYNAHRRWRHHDRVDAGDVLAGVLILGGIAAVASAAKRSSDRRYDYRYRDRPYPSRYPDSRYDTNDTRGIDRAVSMCVNEIERDVRVRDVDGVDRNGDGWRVTGSLYNGDGFSCSIGRDGRIDDIDYAGRGSGWNDGDRYEAEAEDRQYGEDRYRSAWADHDGQVQDESAPAADEPSPAYPGGPVDGDLDEDQIGTGYQGAN